MKDDVIEDLKQFIAAAVIQAASDMATKNDLENLATKDDLVNLATKNDLAKLETKLGTRMDNGFAEVMSAIGDTIAPANELRDQQYHELSGRLTKLEPAKA